MMNNPSVRDFRKGSCATGLLGALLAVLSFGGMEAGHLAAAETVVISGGISGDTIDTPPSLFSPLVSGSVLTMTFVQSGSDVDETGSGTVNLTGLTLQGSSPGPTSSTLVASGGAAAFGSSGAIALYNGFSGPASFGTGGAKTPSSATGNYFGIDRTDNFLFLPASYVSGAALSNSAVFTGQTFASLGLTPGTYTYTWGSGAANSLVVQVVAAPEPGTAALLGTGLLGLCVRRRRGLAISGK